MNSKWNHSKLLIPCCIGANLFASPAFSHLPMPPKRGETGRPAVATAAANFSLIDQEGRIFRFASARGKTVLMTFLYTSCPDVCPLLAARFASIQRALKQERRKDVLLLSITTDPARDTPATLKSYADSFDADIQHWRFLSGPKEELVQVWKRFGVTVKKLGNGEVQHTSLTTLIDRRGIRRIDYFGEQWEEKEVLRDLNLLESPVQPCIAR